MPRSPPPTRVDRERVSSARSGRGSAVPGARRRDVALSPVAWAPQHDMELREWSLHGRRLGAIGRTAGWWLGDWVNYGNAKYGEKYSRASRITGYGAQTLMNMAYVASRFNDFSLRREKLSWSHHALVAALDRVERERWFDRAEADRLSVRDLRELMRNEERRPQQREPREDGVATENTPDGEEVVACPYCGRSFSPGVT